MKKLFALLMVSATLFAVACNNTEEATEETTATEEVVTEEAPAVEEAPATTDTTAAPAEATEAAPAQ